jgi:hypothetical protein
MWREKLVIGCTCRTTVAPCLSGGTPFRRPRPAYPSAGGRQRRYVSARVPEELLPGDDLNSSATYRRDAANAPGARNLPLHRQARICSRNLSNITIASATVNSGGAYPAGPMHRTSSTPIADLVGDELLAGARIPITDLDGKARMFAQLAAKLGCVAAKIHNAQQFTTTCAAPPGCEDCARLLKNCRAHKLRDSQNSNDIRHCAGRMNA